MKFFWLVLLMSLSLIYLTACQTKPSFTLLPQSASNITISKYDGTYKDPDTVVLTGKKKNQLLSALNKSGKHIIPDGAKSSCGADIIQNRVYRDIIVHYQNPNSNRLFELNSTGCTFLNDVKDGIGLYPTSIPNISNYFK